MNRRAFVSGVALGLLALPVAAEARQAGSVPRIGVLVPAEPVSSNEPNIAAFRQGLRDLGYVDGQTIAVTYLYAHGQVTLFPKLVTELVNLRVNVMVVGTGQAAVEAKKITEIIPIVVSGRRTPLAVVLGRASTAQAGMSRAYP